MPQFDISTYTSQLFWLFMTWGILFAYLWIFLVPRMSEKLSNREKKIQYILSQAEMLNQKADQLLADYNTALSELKQSNRDKLNSVGAFIKQSRADLEKDLKKELNLILKQYQARLKQSEQALLRQLPESLDEPLIQFLQNNLPYAPDITPEHLRNLLKKEMEKAHHA